MNDFNPWFLIVALVLIGLAAMVAAVTHAHAKREFETFAKQWRGSISPGGFLGSPTVTFRLGQAVVKLEYTSAGDDGTFTHLNIPVAETKLRLELWQQTPQDKLKKLLGMEDIEIGSAEFDRLFIIQGNSPRRIVETLTPQLQQAILALASWQNMHTPDLHLQLRQGTLRITKHRGLSQALELSRFVKLCGAIQQALEVDAVGIEFVEQQPRVLVKDTQCHICGDPLNEKIVYCAKCKTPHHHDCWEYFGTCAVYGCGQKQFVEFGKR